MLDGLFEPGLSTPPVGGLVGSIAVDGGPEPAADGVAIGGEELVGVAMVGSPEAGEGLLGGLIGFTEGGGACGSVVGALGGLRRRGGGACATGGAVALSGGLGGGELLGDGGGG